MSLRRFLNVAFAILVEEYQRMGVDLMTALEKLAEVGEGAAAEPAVAGPSPRQVAENKSSMEALSGMMASIPNSPLRKPRRGAR
jgi:hypothetical protein